MSSEKKIPAYAKLVEEPDVNKLQFLPDETIYDYNESDLKTKRIIRGNRHNVRKVLHKPSQKLFAIKEITMPYNTYDNSENLIKMISFVQEIGALRQLRNSTHIVQFYGFCVSNDKCLICMEYIDSSLSLKELYLSIHNEKERFPEDLLGCIAVAVVKALKDCHDKKILHRDVKPGNILIKWAGYIKLGDFGEAKITDGTSSTLSGTYYYWPPEKFQWEIDQMNERTDIWSFGITLLEAVRGSLPYSTRDLITVQQGVLKLDSEKEVDKAFDSYEVSTKTFVKSCLLEWKLRPTCKELKEYPFLKEYESYGPKQIESILRKYKSMVKTYDDDISLQLQETSKKPEIRTLLAHTQPFIISFSDEMADDNQQSQVEVASEEIDLKDLGYCSSSDEEEQIDDPSLFVKSVQKLIDPIDHDPKTPSFPTQQEDLVDQRIFEFKNSTLKQVLHKPSNRAIMSKELTSLEWGLNRNDSTLIEKLNSCRSFLRLVECRIKIQKIFNKIKSPAFAYYYGKGPPSAKLAMDKEIFTREIYMENFHYTLRELIMFISDKNSVRATKDVKILLSEESFVRIWLKLLDVIRVFEKINHHFCKNEPRATNFYFTLQDLFVTWDGNIKVVDFKITNMDHEYDYISEYRNIMKSIFQVTEKTKKVQEFYREFTNRVYKSLTSRVYKELLKYLSGPDTILENWKQDAKLKISDIPERIISEYNNSLQLAKNSIKTIVPVIKNIKPENHDQKEYLAFLFDDLISLLDPNTIANSSKSMRRKLDAILKELKDDIDKILYMLSNFYKQIIYAEEYMSYEICLKRSGLKILLGLFDLTDHTDIVEELRKIDSKLRNWCIHKRMFDEEEITPKMLELDHWWWLSKEQIEK